uniref:Uncharacterized protein n=1 Tax=Setaria viridis TaxID=4556 RepID=A0A4U6UVS6_SETVI|nr:hypothetical protein SEVIR_4G107201v2 [Setaria viridis]
MSRPTPPRCSGALGLAPRGPEHPLPELQCRLPLLPWRPGREVGDDRGTVCPGTFRPSSHNRQAGTTRGVTASPPPAPPRLPVPWARST